MTTTPLIVKTRKARKSPIAAALASASRALSRSHCRDIAIKKRTERLTLEIEQMAAAGGGSIINVASDLALISPDQRMYAVGLPEGAPAPVKPVSYSVVKSALLGLTRYLATYWSPIPVRCNALVPGSVGGTQSPNLARELTSRIPLARLAEPDEYQGALVFLLSDASAYMTGANLVMDGGRTAW